MSRFILVRLDDQRYALRLHLVERVVRMVAITALPRAAEAVKGLVNVQGRVLPVISLRGCLGLPEREAGAEDVLIIVRTDQATAALIADGVEGGGEAWEPAGEGASFPGQAYLQGVVKLAGGIVLLIDLDRIAARLAEPLSGLGEVPVPGAAREAGVRALLAERASLLASEPAAAESGECIEAVEFLLGGERYAIESSFVSEVHPLRELTPLPCAPPFLLGLMNMRGKILSVVDIRGFFELRERGGELGKVIILRDAAMEFGLLADAIVGVSIIPLRLLQLPLPTSAGIRGDYLRGVTGEGVALLDAGKMLADKRLVVHEDG